MVIPDSLSLRQTPHGMGVFASREFTESETVLDFRGPIVTRAELPVPYERSPDRFLQIEADRYMGPSGEVDDFVNHSCDPNTGIYVLNGTIGLRAIRAIQRGEEITFDYSTTMDEDEWEMDCSCNAVHCRGRVQDFKKLPEAVRAHYIRLGVVPPYILHALGNDITR